MTDRRSRLSLFALLLLAGVAGGYYFGFAGGRYVRRTGETASDLLIPAEDFRNQRVRREAIRAEMNRILAFQVKRMADTEAYASDTESLEGTEGFLLRSQIRRAGWIARGWRWAEEGWIGELTHQQSPRGEACAAALVVEHAYVGGIPLRRPNRVRCSWDMATRFNRLWLSTPFPGWFGGA